jgi:hypothetical protein
MLYLFSVRQNLFDYKLNFSINLAKSKLKVFQIKDNIDGLN